MHMFASAIQETCSRHLWGMGCFSESSTVYKEDRICRQIRSRWLGLCQESGDLVLFTLHGFWSGLITVTLSLVCGQNLLIGLYVWGRLCQFHWLLGCDLGLSKREDLLLMGTALSCGLLGDKGEKNGEGKWSTRKLSLLPDCGHNVSSRDGL